MTRFIAAASLTLIVVLSSELPAQERTVGDQTTLGASQVFDGSYFAFGETVEISGTVNGDLYASGGEVLVDGRVNGDILAAGGRVILSGTVSQDVRVAGGKVTITGSIGRNLTVAGGDVELAPSASVRGGIVAAGGSVALSAPVDGPAKVAAGTLIVSNRIGGDIDAKVGTFRIASKADIQGNVSYWSGREAVVSEGARIKSKIVRHVSPERPALFPLALSAWLVFVAASFISTLILGLLSLRFLPRFHEAAVGMARGRPLASLGIGFLAVVALPAGCALLFITVVTLPLALALLAAYFILLFWARVFAIGAIGEAILGRLRPNSSPSAAFVLGLFVYYFLAVIPFIGWLVVLLVIFFGLGAELIARKQFYVTARTQNLL